ncbi:hypothetical protein HPC49_38475 [Pyxidicoccus fallax]|uniref:Lipoprotein n=1 Tax=Pyxidicoccus fallax TaxID=394095 RepID=A0A848LC82_9BACT|nr:hypothetical protein [Pyxidicoccus fallax]NMO14333.1 hypothetical protein [Pyxidicoccus fallax]NPC84087.1 hypothetical protein [Pyxidicoccus fallax]
MRFISSVACAAMVLLLATACGESSNPPDAPACGPMSCDGCCNAGTCEPGTTALACGQGGAACRACGTGETCQEGTCEDAPARPDAGDADAGTPDAGDTDAGTPDAGPQQTVVLFAPRGDRPVIPEPNDLQLDPSTGLVRLPVSPDDSPAQQEFTRDYLNTLDGFLTSVAATARTSAPLDPSTVNANTVRVFRASVPPVPGDVGVGYNSDTQRIVVHAPTGWPAGGRYGIAVLGGEQGVRDTQFRQVAGSPVWQWVRSTTPLVDDSGRSTVPGLADVDASALERLRLAYAPWLNDLVSQGIRREDVVALWTFTVTGRPQASFDPWSNTAPYPSNLLLSADGTRVNLPEPRPGAPGFQVELTRGLNKLDGFSTTGVIVSENHPTKGVLSEGQLNPETLAAGTRFLRLGGAGPAPSVVACLNCASSRTPEGGNPTSPPELQFVPQLPLEERTTYAAVMTTDLRDLRDRQVMAAPAWALLRLKAPLVDSQGRSQVAMVPDSIALALEPLRQSLKPALDELEAHGLPRSQVALATVFRTQSTLSALRGLSAVVETLPSAPNYVSDMTHRLAGYGLPHDQLGWLYEVSVPVAHLLTGPGGTIDSTPPQRQRAKALLTVPSGAMPAGGWPVVLFSHELGGSRLDLLYIANELARAGFAAAALDAVHHGDRSTCVGSGLGSGIPDIDSDDDACGEAQWCLNQPGAESHGRCVAPHPSMRQVCDSSPGAEGDVFCAMAGQGRCVSSGDGQGYCEGGDFRRYDTPLYPVAISGWNMLQPHLPFATRDNLRQAAVDQGQLLRVLRSAELAAALGDVRLDTTRPHLVGVGLGAMTGSLFLAVNDDIRRAVLNVPAADPLELQMTSFPMISRREAYLGMLGAMGYTRGTPAFDALTQLQRQALDAADPWNAARALVDRAGAPQGRQVFIQYVEGNATFPTPLTEKFIAAANAGDENRCAVSRWSLPFLPETVRHSFLLQRYPNGVVADAAQRQVTTFLQTGTVPPAGPN